MKYSRKDFRATARAIKAMLSTDAQLIAYNHWEHTFSKANPNFNADMFREACGISSEENLSICNLIAANLNS